MLLILLPFLFRKLSSYPLNLVGGKVSACKFRDLLFIYLPPDKFVQFRV